MKKINYILYPIISFLMLAIFIASCSEDDKPEPIEEVVDLEAPKLLKSFPASGQIDTPVNTSLNLVFNERVKRNAGDIVVYNDADEVLWTFPVGNTDLVKIDNTLVSIELPESLQLEESYYVIIPEGAITDVAENAFKGFVNKTDWSFSTPVPIIGVDNSAKLILHLPFDNNLSDVSGNLLHAFEGENSTGAIEFVNDSERGDVVHFNVGAYATLPKDNLLRPFGMESFSVNFWIRQDAPTGSDPVIIGNSSWDSGGNPGWLLASDYATGYTPDNDHTNGHGWTVNLATTAPGSDRLDWDAGDCTVPGTEPANLGDGSWHMVTIVIDQEVKELRVYADGVLYREPEKANTYDLTRLADGPLYDTVNDYPVNIWEDGTGTYNKTHGALDGFMDDLKIYDGVLLQSDITELYNN
ncbi:Ig-like domain-containing protein [Aestuariivivens sp. NBU2969]|uniref:Ig-like domain-containing protein n=1 Tax=Aestuariivivens sp. NBU2969 TaxID=2873267 RepID=UPI001CBE6D62|nr:Ig-like domain-containing protein [Aestuariivivens sp. NBU2969]